MRILRKTCQLDNHKTRHGISCPRCKRFTCTRCIEGDLRRVMGETISCVFCHYDLIKPKPKPPKIEEFKPPRRTLITNLQKKFKEKLIYLKPRWSKDTPHKLRMAMDFSKDGKPSITEFNKMDEVVITPVDRKYTEMGGREGVRQAILKYCYNRPSSIQTIVDNIPWVSTPPSGHVWTVLKELCDEGKIRKAVTPQGVLIYGPPTPRANDVILDIKYSYT